MTLTLASSKRIAQALCAVVVSLVGLSLAGQISKYLLGHPWLCGFVPAFYVDGESNVPTWYSSIALAMAGGLLTLVACAKFAERDRFRAHWLALALIFFALSADEVAMLHEYPIDPLRRTLDAGGALYYPWVLPGMAFVIAVGIGFARFLLHLPHETRRGMVLAGAIFVGGAIGVEMVSGVVADRMGEENFAYALVITLEEACEMLGVVLLIYTLARYIEQQLGGWRIEVGAALPAR
jgi:hypothetical protein